jgi:O-acetyl-ADP-ribose deacetylase
MDQSSSNKNARQNDMELLLEILQRGTAAKEPEKGPTADGVDDAAVQPRTGSGRQYKIVTADGQEFGPVSAEVIKQWYLDRRIVDEDKVFDPAGQELGPLSRCFDLAAWEHFGILRTFCDGRVTVVVGDITRQRGDTVVNAANSTLLGGAGVDGAIHEAGGPKVLEECQELRRTRFPRGLPAGQAVITTAGRMPSRHVIHTVGPVKGVEGDAELLAACYRNSLRLAVEHGLGSIALPAISTGAYGYPRNEAAVIASKAVAEFLATDETLREVRFVFFSEDDATMFLENQRFSP